MIMDAGISSEYNIEWLKKKGYPFKIDVSKDEKTGNAVKIQWTRQTPPDTKDGLPGVYCLRTSHMELDEDTLWHTYTMLTDLEAVFRSLKSDLGLRPVFHQITKRLAGHLFISVLAYHLVHSICYRLKKSGYYQQLVYSEKAIGRSKPGGGQG